MSHRAKILVIDDDQDCADSTAILLRRLGADASAVYSGAEALALLDQLRPQLVLLDIGMPDMDGYETARRIRQTTAGREVILVALTGWGRQQDRQRTLDAGFDRHFVKPIESEALVALIADASRRVA